MQKTILVVAILSLLTLANMATAQTVRFTTDVGNIDMVLNPDDNPDLQPLVDNLIAYVGLGRYHFSAINRAADGDAGDPTDDFVLQMGGFLGFPPIPELFASRATSVNSFAPVTVDADLDGNVDFDAISNTRGTVSLALSAGNPNSGTSSFFINLGDNDFLDGQGFVPFARIEDMTTVDAILQLAQVDVSREAGSPGNLAFIDVPTLENGQITVVRDVEVIEADDDFSFVGPIATALQIATRNSTADQTNLITGGLLDFAGQGQTPLTISGTTELGLDVQDGAGEAQMLNTVPEPAGVTLALLALLAGLRLRR